MTNLEKTVEKIAAAKELLNQIQALKTEIYNLEHGELEPEIFALKHRKSSLIREALEESNTKAPMTARAISSMMNGALSVHEIAGVARVDRYTIKSEPANFVVRKYLVSQVEEDGELISNVPTSTMKKKALVKKYSVKK